LNNRLFPLLTGLLLLGSFSCVTLAAQPAALQTAPQAVATSTPAPNEAVTEEPPATPAKTVAVANDDDTLVCKREKTLGSNFSTKVCRTKAQIRQDQDAASGALRRGTE